MPPSIPAVNERFGPWVVLAEPVRVGVACAGCGARRRIKLDTLRAGRAHRCSRCHEGSAYRDRGGESSHPIYRAWIGMRWRCSGRGSAKDRRRYHDRGVRVCPEWETSYETFRAWAIANGWAPGLQLDRRDNDGHYSPENCRWATPVENLDNRGVSVRVTAWGETKLLVEWLDDPRCQADYFCIYDRLFRNGNGHKRWEPERALATPKRKMKNNTVRYAPSRRRAA